ncbi:hypothetical protein [Maridesulfovibrio hydrothermalis]|uniref:Uncharacterized protein n=1 Tax=Maridesulfovibrio hydrothermalis AM13 = DSM 14728 TaxID=1121451 RepID=L0RAC3_9BACT|nr:hypothetical protein [Maridesulfovibrio hydrothermalis]CCO23140.1 conserved protein of unknown function [Maridesulfovibrio hydrothermalis AM13 = DSM 14728]
MYYHGFDNKAVSANKYWTSKDDELVSILFAKIVNKTVNTQEPCPEQEELVEQMVNNLFDLCFYINKDVHNC